MFKATFTCSHCGATIVAEGKTQGIASHLLSRKKGQHWDFCGKKVREAVLKASK